MKTHGGRREGAGRPVGRGKYGSELTKTMRVPISRITDIQRLLVQKDTDFPEEYPSFSLVREIQHSPIPWYSSRVQAGFPSPGDDYIERHLDFNQHLVKHPAATFIVTATGDSMTDAGIHSGDMLIVDKSLDAQHGKIVIAAVNGELTVKRLFKQGGRVQLLPANSKYKPIDITEEHELVIWGVVTHVIHNV